MEDAPSVVIAKNMGFTKPGVTHTNWYGFPKLRLPWPFSQGGIWQTLQETKAFVGMVASTGFHEIELHDARAHQADLDYARAGFTLEPLESKVEAWPAVALEGTPERKTYEEELEAVVRRLHPGVKKVVFTSFLLRGGDGENPPAKGSLHLDMHPDKEACDRYAAAGYGAAAVEKKKKEEEEEEEEEGKHREEDGDDDDDDFAAAQAEGLELGLVLGMWKPRQMANPVFDFPLIVADKSTVDMDSVVPQRQKFQHIAEGRTQLVCNLAATMRYSPDAKIYYYPEQTCEELLVFRHYTAPWAVEGGGDGKGKGKGEGELAVANFHGSAALPLPAGAGSRRSIETRAFLYFDKEA